MWFEHFNKISANRAKRAKRADETRNKKKANDYNSTNNKLPIPPTETEDDTCVICEMPDPR